MVREAITAHRNMAHTVTPVSLLIMARVVTTADSSLDLVTAIVGKMVTIVVDIMTSLVRAVIAIIQGAVTDMAATSLVVSMGWVICMGMIWGLLCSCGYEPVQFVDWY